MDLYKCILLEENVVRFFCNIFYVLSPVSVCKHMLLDILGDL